MCILSLSSYRANPCPHLRLLSPLTGQISDMPETTEILRINNLLEYYINIALPIFEHRKNIYIYYTDCMQDKRLPADPDRMRRRFRLPSAGSDRGG